MCCNHLYRCVISLQSKFEKPSLEHLSKCKNWYKNCKNVIKCKNLIKNTHLNLQQLHETQYFRLLPRL